MNAQFLGITPDDSQIHDMTIQKQMRLPHWAKSKHTANTHPAKKLLRSYGVSTVCEEARCPNIAGCFSKPAAAFMILGALCTRKCGFCSVVSGYPEPIDVHEPEKIAGAVKKMGLQYVVITSVTRDDLHDGGAEHFARTVHALHTSLSSVRIEVLTPDFNGSTESLSIVLNSNPDVFNHNIETVPRLYSHIRPHADYRRSLKILEFAKKFSPGIHTKSGIILGFGEKRHEVVDSLTDLRNAGCNIITIGQYLRPSKRNVPVVEYVRPEMFRKLRTIALEMGFLHVASGPLVRSSMNAEEMYQGILSAG